jgi:hypothetical protein
MKRLNYKAIVNSADSLNQRKISSIRFGQIYFPQGSLMKSSDFAIITPSYTPDFERCKLLAWSVQQFCQSSATHYIIVTHQDYPLFKQLQGSRTEVITVESILPRWLFKLPLIKNGWLSLKTPPIRNWVAQQLVKLSVGQYLNQEVMTFVDSDLTFIRPFDLQNFVQGSQVRLFRVKVDDPTRAANPWENAAAKLLGLPAQPIANYIGGIVTWKRENVLKLHRHIEQVSGRGYMETLCRSWHLSEYILYGAFVDSVLQNAGHIWNDRPVCKEYWNPTQLTDDELATFFQEVNDEHLAVMISAKANIAPSRYQSLIKTIPAAVSSF